MALYNTIIGNLTNANLNTLIGPVGATTKESASVLLRIIALIALTHRERNPLGGGVEWYQKLFPPYDCLFPFSGNIITAPLGGNRTVNCFPNNRVNDDIDLNIANGEFGVNVNGARATTEHYIAFIAAAAGGGMNQRGAKVANGGTALGEANAGGSIPVDDENITALDIHTFYNNYTVARNVVNMNFFDEVNVVHNIQKLLARKNIQAVRELRGYGTIYDRTLKVSVANQGPSTSTILQKAGKFEFTEIGSWGAHDDSTEEKDGLLYLKNQLRGTGGLTNEQTELVRIFRDLYRLECIREPAALITNAMFVDLAMFNTNAGYIAIGGAIDRNKNKPKTRTNPGGFTFIANECTFANIRYHMPMTFLGPVDAARHVWKDIMLVHNNIYYKYDYVRYSNVLNTEREVLTGLENNLLFNYIMHQADQLDTANVGAGNITARLRNNVLNATTVTAGAGTQQAALAGGINSWQLVLGTSATGVGVAGGAPAPVPALGVLPAGVASIYQVTVPITIAGANHNIVFQARFPNTGNPIQATDIYITSFPLALINQLLLEWYQVDIGLVAASNQDIQIDLNFRDIDMTNKAYKL